MSFIAFLLVSPCCEGPALAASSGSDLEQGFLHPPDSARPWVYWFPLDGNISSNGITADLEAMKRVGIGGVLYMETDQGAPKGPARFGGPLWRDLFKHICAEASRLGLEVNMNNDAGWCGSGGPWITPELSMQKVVWTETTLRGPSRFDGTLPQPQAVRDFYRDIAVFAFPTPVGDDVRMTEHSPKLTASTTNGSSDLKKLLDGNPKTTVSLPRPERNKPQFVQIEFAQPFAARLLSLTLGGTGRVSCHGALQVSDDGQKFKTIREFDARPGSSSLVFPEVSSRFFRVLFTKADAKMNPIVLADLELNPRYRIENIQGKSALTRQEFVPQATYPTLAAELAIARDRIIDLTPKLAQDGRLTWDVPAGQWTVLRFGHTTTGKDNHPAPLEGRGLECDKLSKQAAEAMFNGLMAKLIEDSKPLVPKTLVSTHIDSWEVGSQNWTPKFRTEFQRLRGYDPMPLLPVLTGRVVDSLEVSERFLWDVRQTVNDLLVDNYAGHFREQAHRHGLRLSIEAYDGAPTDDLTYAGRADEPMAEFWSWAPYGAAYSCTEMASSAHVYGKRILGAEAFTATDAEKWQGHPFSVKVYGDWAFCEGINRFVFHRYALQPWTNPDRAPGMSMGPWGLHYERGQTWWEQSKAWHEYLARCQYLLQQGLFVADICYLAAERSPQRWQPPTPSLDRPAYNFDGCPPEVVLTRMTVQDGKLMLPDGMSYRVLVLPDVETMTPRLLRKITALVKDGATVIGPRPLKSPSLSNYPKCDAEVRTLADKLWATCDGKTVQEHRFGKGKVVWGKTPQEVLAGLGIGPDFSFRGKTPGVGLRYIHRTIGDAEVYFVANKNQQAAEALCSFRAPGKQPELWWPDTGRIERVAAYDEAQATIRLPMRFDPVGSVFAVFRPAKGTAPGRITSVTRDGEPVLETAWKQAFEPAGDNNRNIVGTFSMAVWARPDAEIALPKEANAGVFLTQRRNDALYPPPGHEVGWEAGHAGTGISVGRNGVCVWEHSADYFAPLLVHAAPITGWTHLVVVYQDGQPSLYLSGKLVRKGLKSLFQAHPGVGVQHGRSVESFKGELGTFAQFARALTEAEIAQLTKSMPLPAARPQTPPIQVAAADESRRTLEVEVSQPGHYELKSAGTSMRHFDIPSVSAPLAITGPWDLQFAPNGGAPKRVTLEKLISWSEHNDSGVRYYSGHATYQTTFRWNPTPSAPGQLESVVYLDLGKVAVMAEVKLNGQDLGVLWKPPFRVAVTKALQPGDNTLEVKVVNLWINRLIGDEHLPEDSQRNANGTLKEWPSWLNEGKPNPAGRFTFTSWRLYKKDDPLADSGLLGPVTLQTAMKVELPPR